MTLPVSLIVEDVPRSGDLNMAIDEQLLIESLSSGRAFVRIYGWAEATVSLGYFQNESERAVDPRLTGLPCVRRLSGGGAILHHHEQTYSCSLPPDHPLAEQPYQLYEQVHAAIMDVLASLGISVQPRGAVTKSQPEPFLCFLREAPPDLVFQGHKVLGSAQRRRKGAVLQHGSLLLRQSEHAPELAGLSDLVSGFEWSDVLRQSLGMTIARVIANAANTTVELFASDDSAV